MTYYPSDMTYYTFDNVPVVVGLQVWTNEWEEGVITTVARFPGDLGREDDVWHEVTYPNGRMVTMNRERITTRKPY